MTSIISLQSISEMNSASPRQQCNSDHILHGEDYGQYIDIHPNMYEYKRQVSTYSSKFVVKQFISTDCFDESGNIQSINIQSPYPSDHSFYHNDKDLCSKMYQTNFSRYLLLCIIYAINYFNQWFTK